MTHPRFPSGRVLPFDGPVDDPYLFDTIRQWRWASTMCDADPFYRPIARDLDRELRGLEDRLYAAVREPDERPRLAAFERLVRGHHEGAEGVCIEFLGHADEYVRYVAAEAAIELATPAIESQLLRMLDAEPCPAVVAAACGSLVPQPGDKRGVVAALLRVFGREWQVDDADQRAHPKDAALRAIDEVLGTSYVTRRLGNGLYAVPTTYDVPSLVADAGRFVDEGRR